VHGARRSSRSPRIFWRRRRRISRSSTALRGCGVSPTAGRRSPRSRGSATPAPASAW
jgi:hypothetical protein